MSEATHARPPSRIAVGVTALLVTCAAFLIYRSTMLPGVDLGDTPSFQTMGGSLYISPRDAYPLYFALAAPLVWLSSNDTAHAMNLASVLQAALACGLTVVVAAELSGSLGAALVAALVFGTSYTFWSQAVTTEVYALHIVILALTLLMVWRWQREPTHGRLVAFFLVYAIGFANHLSMIVLLPALTAFVVIVTRGSPAGAAGLFRPRVLATAGLCALAGALPYLWTIRTMLIDPVPVRGAAEAARWFWFEVTKADWRETMMLEVPRVMVSERLRMFAFDVRQQFGVLMLLTAAGGAWAIARTAPSRLCLLLIWLASTALFALTYSVGDTHVFLLPFHFVVALLVAPGLVGLASVVARVGGQHARRWVLVAAGLLSVLRAYNEYPALDRSDDRRAELALANLTAEFDDSRAILLTDLNWQLQNGLNYYVDHARRNVAVARVAEVLPYAPTLIRDNESIGRSTAVTERARDQLAGAYGPAFTFATAFAPEPLPSRVARTPRGRRYVVCWLKPTPEVVVDRSEVDRTLGYLTAGKLTALPDGDFVVVGGLVGEAPALVRAGNVPFRSQAALDGLSVTVRMDAWFPFDTIRRMGFGHVIAGRHHSLIVERGLSFVALDDQGRAAQVEYAAGLFEPQSTFRVVRP